MTQRKAFVWVESLEVSDMAFSCVQSFDIGFDAHFIDLQCLTPRSDLKHINLKYDCSKLFHSFRDTEKHAKSKLTCELENAYGIVPSTMGGNKRALASLDWLLLLMDGYVSLVQCKGLRNAPSAQYEFATLKKIQLPSDLRATTTFSRILTSAMVSFGKFDDKFSLIGMNDRGTNLFKCTVDLASAPALRLGGNSESLTA